MTLLEGDGYVIDAGYSEADVIVKDKDPLPVVRFKPDGNYLRQTRVSEDVGTYQYPVELVSDLPVLRDVTVEYEVSEQYKVDGKDVDVVENTPMTLTIPAGQTTGAIEIPVIQDNIAERNETVYIDLRKPVHAKLPYRLLSLTAWLIIEDDEPTVTLERAQAAVNEGDDAEFTLTRDQDTSAELTVWVQVAHSAPVSASSQETVVFAAGHDTATLAIPTSNYDAGGARP